MKSQECGPTKPESDKRNLFIIENRKFENKISRQGIIRYCVDELSHETVKKLAGDNHFLDRAFSTKRGSRG